MFLKKLFKKKEPKIEGPKPIDKPNPIPVPKDPTIKDK